MSDVSRDDIEKFLSIFNKLSNFEAQHRQIRNWGALNTDELPCQPVIKVINWLTAVKENIK